MKFTQNTPVVAPKTTGITPVQAIKNPMAYGGKDESMAAYAGAMGHVLKIAQQQQDDMDAADHMERRNKIMGNITERLYGENGILTNGIGENAKGLTGKVTQVVQEEFQNGMKGANSRVRRSMAGTFNENMGNYQRIAAQQEGREFRKQKEAHYGLSVDNSVNMAMLNYQNADLLDSNISDVMRIVDWRAKDMGWNEEQRLQERRNVLTAVAGAAIHKAIEDGDLDTASIYNDRYGKYMNQKDIMQYQKTIRGEKRIQEEKTTLDDIFSRHKIGENDYDWNAIYDEIDRLSRETKVVGGGGSNDIFVNIAQEAAAIIRQKYPDASPNLEKYLYGQMMRETGWGKDPIALEYNNFAGLHGGAKGRKYADYHEFAKDYASFFTDGYHTQAIYAADGNDFARRLSNKLDGGSGWYEDRNYQGYGQTIMEAMADYDKKSAASGVSFETLDSDIDASGVNIDGAQPQTIGMINRAKQIYKNLFGRDDFWVSSVTGGHDDGTPHALGYKADVGGSALKESYENRIKFQQALQAEGIGANNEYDMPSKNSTGGHFDLDSRGKNWQTGEDFGGFKGGGGGGHTVNAHDSGWADRMKRLANARRQELEYRKANDQKAKLENYKTQADGLGAEGALQLVERLRNGGEDMQIVKALESHVYGRYDLTRRGNGGNGGGSSGRRNSKERIPGVTGEYGNSGKWYTNAQIDEANYYMAVYRNRLANDGDRISEADQTKLYNPASELLTDIENKKFTRELMNATAQAWSQTQDYKKCIELMKAGYDMTETDAITYLDHYLENNQEEGE